MSIVGQDFQGLTYDDYYNMEDDGNRYELIDGELYAMAAPSIRHQEILGNLFLEIRTFLKGEKKCRVFIAPVDVRLNHQKKDDTVVQPDLIVVCDPSKTEDGKSVKGAPDFVVEIFSSSTRKRDIQIKLPKYKKAGVKEIWLIEPDTEMVMVFKPEYGDENMARIYTTDEEITLSILPELTISTNDIFAGVVTEED
ncbi:MAG: Uma2 family endonuclease [Defluviitaleaceae bacterium]|nr:Uma2 family endonuclease [Defluviitaleaceae bacterium]